MTNTILMVDEDPEFLHVMRVQFASEGLTAYTAARGIEALHSARRLLPDVIIIDLLLPDLDGLTVCEILRTQPSTALTPILMLASVSGQLYRLAGLDAGADDYATKPIGPKELVRRVLKLLQRTVSIDPTPLN